MISFTPLQLYPQGKSPGTHLIEGWVDPRVGLVDREKWKFLSVPGPELQPLSCPVLILTELPSNELHWLHTLWLFLAVYTSSYWITSALDISICIRVAFLCSICLYSNKKNSMDELYRPSDRRLSAKWLPTFADRGCHVVSVTDP
jgi:hypothetical protein